MRAVGIRELKNRLSEYVRLVQTGERVLVTDRGRVVAELGPPGAVQSASSLPPGLVELASRGSLRLGAVGQKHTYRRMRRLVADGVARRLLDEERGRR